ncbi:hypothetical protein ACIBSW_04230 [Actinoplanes sp. NPDC049668]|uniref:hypothetical protein n=1 Tax=unclassified Actinoplanes TaxID=2626549 RepID=UPI0033BB8792
MYVVLAWFGHRSLPEERIRAARDRFESAVSALVPETYLRQEFGGADWGVTFLHRSDQGAYRWPMVATDGPVSALSLGLPVGADTAGGPVALARRLLAGADIHRDVVPPFGLIALDGDQRFAIQQDWIGMCRLFTGAADGITALCSRPSLLTTFLHGTAEPDLDGWASYAVTGHFGGDLSPVRGARLLQPGERVTGRRRPGGGWDVATETRYGVDDLVMSGFAGQGRPTEESLDLAAQAITTTAGSISDLYADPITLGLSGGKDSRLIAASLIAGGRLPRFATNEDTAAEGEVARELVRILRDKRGLTPEHRLTRSGAPDDVLRVGLRERTARLQRLHDFQFPSTYIGRPAGREQLRDDAIPASFTGAAGELSTGYWYPAAGGRTPEEEALARLMAAVPKDVVAESATAAERVRITGLLDHAKDIGLRDVHLIDYIYLTERVRRWYTSAYSIGMVTPFLSPGFVAATFGLTAEQKRERLLHTSLIGRLVPEWADVPFVSVSTGKSTAARIWDGDGVRTIADLVDTAQGPIAQLIRRDAVEKALTTAVHKDRADQRTLRQFAWLAMASEQLEPGTVGTATLATYDRVTTPPKPPKPKPPVVKRRRSRLRWLKNTLLWRAARKVLR